MLNHFRSTRPLFLNSHSHYKIGICCKYCHIPRLPRCLCFLLPYCLCVNSPPFPWCTALHKPGLIQIHKDKKTNIQIHKHALSTTQYCLGVQHCISQDCRRRLILPDFPGGAFEVLSPPSCGQCTTYKEEQGRKGKQRENKLKKGNKGVHFRYSCLSPPLCGQCTTYKEE